MVHQADNEITQALEYVGIFPDSKRREMILQAPDYIKNYVFDRITEIMLCDREYKSHVNYMAEADRYFDSLMTDPGGELTDKQMKEIEEFWKPYEFFYKNDPKRQRICSLISGRFDPSYIPWSVYKFTRRYWGHAFGSYITNKNLSQRAFPNVKKAKAVIRCYGECYYDADYNVIPFDQACDACFDYLNAPEHDEIIVKSCRGGEGKGITFLKKGTSREEIRAFLGAYDGPFIAEEIIINHEKYAEPHPKSLNTLRVLTMAHKSKIYLGCVVLRIGMGDNRMDNVSQGGLAVLVKENGELSDFALDHLNRKVYKHPDGYVFAGKKLPYVDKVIEAAKKCHSECPQQKMIGWDFTVDKSGDPVLIELNPIADQFFSQAFGCPTFINKEIAKELLDDWILKQFSFRRASWNWNYREYSDHIEIIKYCGLYKSVSVPEKMDGKPVTVIKDGAFTTAMTCIRVPTTIKTIGANAFSKAGADCKIIRLSDDQDK